MRTDALQRVPRAVTTRSWRTIWRDSRTSTSASPRIGPIVTCPSETRRARSKTTRSIRVPRVPTIRSGLPVRQRTTSSRYSRGRRTIVPPVRRSARAADSNSALLATRTVAPRVPTCVPALHRPRSRALTRRRRQRYECPTPETSDDPNVVRSRERHPGVRRCSSVEDRSPDGRQAGKGVGREGIAECHLRRNPSGG